MSNAVKLAVPVIRNGIGFVQKHWKIITAALAFMSKFVADHPELPVRVREQFERMRRRILLQVVKPSEEAQVRGMLEVVRDEARDAGDDFESQPWVDRADAIERDLRLVKVQQGAARKRSLSRLHDETDRLVADLLLALSDRRSNSR